MSDVHLGSFREKELRELNLRAFEKAVDVCLERKVDFVIIAGDFFDIALPEMGVVDRAVKKMREAQALGLTFYLVYGSHDYSPTETSIIDVLCSAGVLVKVVAFEQAGEGQKLAPKVFTDAKTGVSLVGVSARARGLENADFEKIDFSQVEKLSGPKVFVFHSAILEHTPELLRGSGGVSINALPKGFDYYASGHVHLPQVIRDKALGGAPLVFPGPLSASDYRDLEALDSEKHGFWIAELKDGGCEVERVDLDVCTVELIQYDASGKNSAVVQQDLLDLVNSKNLAGKVVLLKARGVLSGGSPKDIDFTMLREKANAKNPLVFYLNRNALESREREELVASRADAGAIEESLFRQSLASAGISEELKGERGLMQSKKLLSVLKAEQPFGETKNDFEARIAAAARKVLES